MNAIRWIAAGMLLGVLGWGLIRFVATPWPDPPHFHANWMVVVDGEPLDLSADRYMEDVAACTGPDHVAPRERVHMHNNEDDVVHVHHHGVAWGHFLENLGFDAGRDYLILSDDLRLFNDGERTVKYVVNGFARDEIGTAPIRSGDRLLISYGPETVDQVIAVQFPNVADDAEEYNTRQDPAGCAGAAGMTLTERLRRAFWG